MSYTSPKVQSNTYSSLPATALWMWPALGYFIRHCHNRSRKRGHERLPDATTHSSPSAHVYSDLELWRSLALNLSRPPRDDR